MINVNAMYVFMYVMYVCMICVAMLNIYVMNSVWGMYVGVYVMIV